MKTEDAIASSHILVMAIPKDYYKEQPMELLQGKIDIDVSNRTTVHRKEGISQAEYLQTLLPKSAASCVSSAKLKKIHGDGLIGF